MIVIDVHEVTAPVHAETRLLRISVRRTQSWRVRLVSVIVNVLLACLILDSNAIVAQASGNLVVYLEQRLGLSEPQARGALGALLVYAQQRLPKTDFDSLAARVPNADSIMQQVKLRGIVTGPLDDMDHYEKALASLGIGQPLASRIGPAVLEYLGATGHDLERDILAGIMQ
jgi:hypothetical protein